MEQIEETSLQRVRGHRGRDPLQNLKKKKMVGASHVIQNRIMKDKLKVKENWGGGRKIYRRPE